MLGENERDLEEWQKLSHTHIIIFYLVECLCSQTDT